MHFRSSSYCGMGNEIQYGLWRHPRTILIMENTYAKPESLSLLVVLKFAMILSEEQSDTCTRFCNAMMYKARHFDNTA
jgi:hypothetical protein